VILKGPPRGLARSELKKVLAMLGIIPTQISSKADFSAQVKGTSSI